MISIVREAMKKRPWVRRLKETVMRAGDSAKNLDRKTAWALVAYGRRRKWVMAQRLEEDGTYTVGREK